MQRVSITPDNEEHWLGLRATDLTSTDVAALFGLSPYKTAFELWHEKSGNDPAEFSDNDRMLWGRRLQDAIAQGIADDVGLIARPMTEYMRIDGLRLGSSFDWAIEGVRDDSPFAATFAAHGPGILEIKNVDWLAFKRGWVIDKDFVEAPAHIEVQTQHQQLISGRRWSIIGALVGGNRYELLERLADDEVHRGILSRAADFWRSIDANDPPPPVMPDDADAVIALHQFAEPGKLLDARDDAELATLLRQYQRLGLDEKVASESRKVIKAEILTRIGDAEKVLTAAGKISASITGPAEVKAFTRAPFRNFRFTPQAASDAAAAE